MNNKTINCLFLFILTGLKTLTRLGILDLSWSNIIMDIPSNWGDFTSLKALSLANSRFNVSFPISGNLFE